MTGGEIRIEGLAELREALLRKIPAEMQGKVLQAALAAGARITVAKAKTLAPVKSGKLRKAIYSTRDRYASKPTFETRAVTVRRKGALDAYYWRWVEFGHRVVPRGRRGLTQREARAQATQFVAPRPFMRPAFDSTKEQAAAAIRDRLKVEIEKAGKKASWGRR